MKTVKVIENFEGWPTGKAPVNYTAGEEVELSNDFADLIIGKGHAKEVATKEAPAGAEAPKATSTKEQGA